MMTKVLSIISALGIVCSLVMIILWQSTKNELNELQSKHMKLQGEYSSLVLSKEQLEASNKVTSDLIFALNAELFKLRKEEETSVTDILLFKPKCVPPKTTESKEDEIEYADIDAPFDPELLRLYKGSDNL